MLKTYMAPFQFNRMKVTVPRRLYLKRLESGRDRTDLVKIITGMRRCGKTVLMEQFIELLKGTGVPEGSIVHINLESEESAHIHGYLDLLAEIRRRADTNGRIYLFLDEIQMVDGWEKAINAIQADMDADIYITGSNAYMLSSDLSTLISGRYVELRMLPLSFAEFLELHPGNEEMRFRQYIRSGSMPASDPDGDEAFERDHLKGLFNTVLVKDVMERIKIHSNANVTDICRFLYSNIGNITSCNNIARSENISNRDVRACLDALQDAFLFYKCERYDIRGKRLMDSLEKYYVSDTGIRNAVLGISSREDDSRQIENIVYLELIRRGYEVCVGKYGDTKVDFTARKGDSIEYYQVTMTMLPEDTYEREVRSLRRIQDNWPKTVLSMDRFLTGIPDGIVHRNIIDWLLDRP